MAPSRGKSVCRVCQTVNLQPVSSNPSNPVKPPHKWSIRNHGRTWVNNSASARSYSRHHAPPGDRRFASAGVVWTPWTHDEAHDEAQDRDCLQM